MTSDGLFKLRLHLQQNISIKLLYDISFRYKQSFSNQKTLKIRLRTDS